jgi:RND family efflux transporter MFP subunit
MTPCRRLPLLLAFALAACSGGEPAPATATAESGAYVAIARGQVDVEGGLVRVASMRDGRIDEVLAHEGDAVKQGAVLVRLDARPARSALAIAEATLAQARAQAAVAKARVAPVAAQARRVGEAAGEGAATGQASDEAKAALAVLQAEVAAAEAGVEVARGQAEAARADVEARALRAPVAGLVVHRSAQVGDAVQAGTELLQLLPDRPRIVRAELGEAYVDRIRPGMLADVVRDADQGPSVRARVLRVGAVFGASRLTDDPVERAGAHDVECVLQLEGGEFRIGQRVLVRFLRAGTRAEG